MSELVVMPPAIYKPNTKDLNLNGYIAEKPHYAAER